MTSDSQAAIDELSLAMKRVRIIIQSLQGKTDKREIPDALILMGVVEKMVRDCLK